MFLAHWSLRLRWRVTRVGPSKRAIKQFRWSSLPYSFPTSSSSLQSCSKSRTASIASLGNQARTLDFDIRSLREGLYSNASTHLEGPGPMIVRNGPLFFFFFRNMRGRGTNSRLDHIYSLWNSNLVFLATEFLPA